MWSYYGSKSKVVHLYPPPLHNKIIEPFAGTAQYALRWFERDVLILDKYELLVKIWRWLQKCSEADILGLPMLKPGESVDDYHWDCDEAKWLVGLIITGGPTSPKKQASRWKTVIRPNTQRYKLRLIAGSLFKIRHWTILHGTYEDIPNQVATWFIDPPYQHGGEYYTVNNRTIDYPALARWCQARAGQVIVCENMKANWLPFYPVRKMRGSVYSTTEAVWSNMPIPRQIELF